MIINDFVLRASLSKYAYITYFLLYVFVTLGREPLPLLSLHDAEEALLYQKTVATTTPLSRYLSKDKNSGNPGSRTSTAAGGGGGVDSFALNSVLRGGAGCIPEPVDSIRITDVANVDTVIEVRGVVGQASDYLKRLVDFLDLLIKV